jgi:hypothetical protein
MTEPLPIKKHPKPTFEELKEVNDVSDKLVHGLMTVATGALGLSITFRSTIVGDDPTALWLLGSSWVFFILVVIGYVVDRLAFFELLRRRAFGEELWATAGFFSSMGRLLAMIGFLLGILLLTLFGLINIR